MRNKLYLLSLISYLLILAGCSTTSRLAPDEELYNGIKKLTVVGDSGVKVPPGLKSEISSAVNVKPNNPWPMTNIRNPFPIGLWIWNHWSGHEKGLKHWVYEKFASEPVLISEVRPDLRVKMIDQILDNNGFFRGSASYTTSHKKNPQITSVSYQVETGPAYLLDSIELLPDTCRLYHLIDSVARRQTYLRPGVRYCVDSLKNVRTVIATAMRNRGYYFFNPEYIEYLADSINQGPQRIALRMVMAANTPPLMLKEYRVGDVTMILRRNDGTGTPDTVKTSRCTLVQFMPSRFRRQLVDECITLRPGRDIRINALNNTQTRLSRLGIFSNIDINIVPPDSASWVRGDDRLNVVVDCTLDRPLEATIEANVSSKSNSYIGPGIMLGLTQNNLFGGGEQLGITLTGSYEWQTGANHSNVFNSYEAGLQASLAFPRLLAPKFIPRLKRDLSWTRISLNADLLNRPHYFRMAQFNASFAYDWSPSRYSTNTLTLLKLTYNNLLHTTEDFDSLMAANRAVALSFRSQFLPQIMYTYQYDRVFGGMNQLSWNATAQEAGGVFCGIWRACGVKGEKKLFGIPISQFFKVSGQIVYGRKLSYSKDLWLVMRAATGVAHAYGNSKEVPYSEQFWVGGANSIRAFTVRSIGPGSYRPEKSKSGDYFDQTGTFKFEANVEFRFPIIGPLHGAVFVDSGNVWLLKKDPQRPGGQLQARSFLRDLALGTGVGLRVDVGILVIRGDLGIGIHAPYDTGKPGYYNMTSFKNSLAFHLAIGYPF
ncbi:MAG: BamA/TamA family outer membrane protein [Bacteroides sp.]|nr:BamA/TamA family outer membrane protein [Bacteroides sp.]MCM1378979.1 BamA/TamA family outer membrane protein [Bacteroides sp.]MCM1445595.1 BamA/TamA family outer membrane protein [Prevotella sp.]